MWTGIAVSILAASTSHGNSLKITEYLSVDFSIIYNSQHMGTT